MMFLHFAASAARTESHTYERQERETAASGLGGARAPERRRGAKALPCSSSGSVAVPALVTIAVSSLLGVIRLRGLAPPPLLAPPLRNGGFLPPSAFICSFQMHN